MLKSPIREQNLFSSEILSNNGSMDSLINCWIDIVLVGWRYMHPKIMFFLSGRITSIKVDS